MTCSVEPVARTNRRTAPTLHVPFAECADCPRFQSGDTSPHSKTLRVLRTAPNFRQVLDCGGPPPLFQSVFIRVHQWLNPFKNFVGRQLRKQLRNRFALSRQNQIRRDFAQRLKHKPPQMRPRMRQNQIRRITCFCAKRNQIQIQQSEVRSKLFSAGRPNSFSSLRSFSSNDSGVSPVLAARPTTAFTNGGESGGQFTGDVCQSEDLRIGWLEKFCSRAIASKTIWRESPRLEPSATNASVLTF